MLYITPTLTGRYYRLHSFADINKAQVGKKVKRSRMTLVAITNTNWQCPIAQSISVVKSLDSYHKQILKLLARQGSIRMEIPKDLIYPKHFAY